MRATLKSIAARLGWIPYGTRVDGASFSDDEYPVTCLNCGYDLRRLSDGRCPECGRPFARGHLLVEIYARGRRPLGPSQKRLRNFTLAYVILWFVSIETMACLVASMDATLHRIFKFVDSYPAARWSFVVFMGTGDLASIGVFVGQATGRPPPEKRKSVRGAVLKVLLRAS